ncbi:hypothetical protein OBV_36570 [Oscillibacter valericigenes Sjm18-20]|nr:hypothetical protein OBV_36570 [Oscillibacter valericigenes Sjm18-20]
MADFLIAAASTADLPAEYFTEHNVPVIRYTYILDNEQFADDCQEASRENLYKRMREGTAITTSMINAYTYYHFFKCQRQ